MLLCVCVRLFFFVSFNGGGSNHIPLIGTSLSPFSLNSPLLLCAHSPFCLPAHLPVCSFSFFLSFFLSLHYDYHFSFCAVHVCVCVSERKRLFLSLPHTILRGKLDTTTHNAHTHTHKNQFFLLQQQRLLPFFLRTWRPPSVCCCCSNKEYHVTHFYSK